MLPASVPQRLAHRLTGHQGAVLAVTFNSDGNYCLTAGADRTIRLWNSHSAKLIKEYEGHGREVFGLAVSQDHSRIASCGADKLVFLWDVGSARVIRKFQGHYDKVNSVAFNAEGSLLVTGSNDATVRIWDLRSNTFEAIQKLDEAKDSVMSVCFTGDSILAGCVDGRVRTYEIRTGRLIMDDVHHPVSSVQVTHDDKCILVSSMDHSVRLLDRESGQQLNQFTGHINDKYKVQSCLSGDDSLVFSGSEDGKIYVWDLVEAKVLKRLEGHRKCVASISHHPSEPLLLSGAVDGTVLLWRGRDDE